MFQPDITVIGGKARSAGRQLCGRPLVVVVEDVASECVTACPDNGSIELDLKVNASVRRGQRLR